MTTKSASVFGASVSVPGPAVCVLSGLPQSFLQKSKKKMMANSSPNVASRLYALAVARDTANLVDADAALALARASTRTLMALSPQAAQLMRYFAQEEIDRLSMDCTEESQGSIAIIQDALNAA